MHVFELFDKHASWEWVETPDYGDVDAHFMIGDTEIVVAFIEEPSRQEWWIEFGHPTKEGGLEKGITGTGNAFQIFSTVIEIIRAFVQKHNPKTIIFESHDSSRTKLYDRIIKELAKEWNVETEDGPQGRIYILTRGSATPNENRTRA